MISFDEKFFAFGMLDVVDMSDTHFNSALLSFSTRLSAFERGVL